MKENLTKHGIKVIFQPPSSPDLNPLDYSLWSLLAEEVGAQESKEACSAAIIRATRKFNNDWDLHHHIILEGFPKRLRKCIDCDGGHFET